VRPHLEVEELEALRKATAISGDFHADQQRCQRIQRLNYTEELGELVSDLKDHGIAAGADLNVPQALVPANPSILS
jgi:hypothetical protein